MNHREQVIEILSQPSYLDLPTEYLRPSLTGRLFISVPKTILSRKTFMSLTLRMQGFPGVQMATA